MKYTAAAASVAVAVLLSACGVHDLAATDARTTLNSSETDGSWAHFAIFRRPRTQADRLPPELSAKSVVGGLGLQKQESRVASVNRLGRFYLVPARRSLCILSTDRVTGVCWPRRVVDAGNAVTTAVCAPGLGPGATELAGVVPDRVGTVSIISVTGRRRSAPVRGNVFVDRLDAAHFVPRQIVWIKRGSIHRQVTGISPPAIHEGCDAHTPPD